MHQQKTWLLCRLLQRVHGTSYRQGTASVSAERIHSNSNVKIEKEQAEIQRSVYVSTNNNIFSNLALEDWLYKNGKFDKRSILVLWRNDPCVVIGRHQNPWAECDVQELIRQDVSLARRRSGGGTVYHDRGNLNCSFFTSRAKYNRKANLELVVRALRKRWNLDVAASDRDDILLNGKYKEGLRSRATESVRSTVGNLCAVVPGIQYHMLVEALASEYLGQECQHKYQLVEPTQETRFPGLYVFEQELQSWHWVYGKTPDFTLNRTFTRVVGSNTVTLQCQLKIHKGHVTQVNMDMQPAILDTNEIEQISHTIQGQRFWYSQMFLQKIENPHTNSMKIAAFTWILQCLAELFMK